jgi:hypothetical protein
MRRKSIFIFWMICQCSVATTAQKSIARRWNEQVLHAISNDFARPVVHARNLFHTSIAMYDAWAVYDPLADTYFIGKTVHGFYCSYRAVPSPDDIVSAQEEAISFAVYRLLLHRFSKSPGAIEIRAAANALMDSLGYNRFNRSINYKCGPAEMGNYIASKLIEFGLQDGANEVEDYRNQFYKPSNLPLLPELPGNMNMADVNRWQPLMFTQFIDQSGNIFNNSIPNFLGAEWGSVLPFAMRNEDAEVLIRDGYDYTVYHNPGQPALLDTTNNGTISEAFKWNFSLVGVWGGLLKPLDSIFIDISPATIGNNSNYPESFEEYQDFYNFFEGGDYSQGHVLNPKTGLPYAKQMVPRGDYYRVLAEFWSDGPDSETPPGHWFSILNYVNDQPGLEKRIRGEGPVCTPLEWDVKAYFTLGGAMHDAAITAWSIKGYYDSSRPVSVIRKMAAYGQSTDPTLPNYHPGGLPIIPGHIEQIKSDDPLRGVNGQYIGEIKINTWRGPNFIDDPAVDAAGTGWIRAANWWPYQRPTFVSPPFAGYISGHSTFSSAGAEVLAGITGDSYFPGGMGSFYCPKNTFLVFEEGPSQDIVLQWATYVDAADQCSLSRIFGGIHPPMDDIPGRQIGKEVGRAALDYATTFFTSSPIRDTVINLSIFPNPTDCVMQVEIPIEGQVYTDVYSVDGKLVLSSQLDLRNGKAILDLSSISSGVYFLIARDEKSWELFSGRIVKY